ncbi:hypothetical protein BC938DRAFT_478908 [Jimgerdemannia flammicorona]|uniref:Epg5-like central TPR repeats domain-containing protein n=1 Tax=Jimgerdemannia flammicorona TaxID=994334 RepID=A0A433QM33_9FUNG|nr:hypothetical protein BC938DRAFT_478908 [Jimgerdemannia flammicorona]
MIFLQGMMRTLGIHLGKQSSLVEFVVDLMDLDEHKVKLLHSIFNPGCSPQKFVELYRRISDSSTYSLKCQAKLLPRFDAVAWMTSTPAPSVEERHLCYSIAFEAIKKIGRSPTADQNLVLKEHWRFVSALTKSNMSDYIHVLENILDACTTDMVDENILDNFISAIGFNLEKLPLILDDTLDVGFVTSSSSVNRDQMCSIIDFLEQYFTGAEQKRGSLYRTYGLHIPAIVRLLTFILCDHRLMIDLPVTGQGWTSWDLIRRAYKPWLLSISFDQGDRRKQLDKNDALVERRQREVRSIATSFASVIKKLVNSREKLSKEVLHSVWDFYVALIKIDFPAKYALILHEQLQRLPWAFLEFDSSRLKLILELRVPLKDDMRVEFLRFVAFQLQSWTTLAPEELSANITTEDFVPLIAYVLLLVVQDVDNMYPDEKARVEVLMALDQNIVHALEWTSLGEDDYTGIVNELKTIWQHPLDIAVVPDRSFSSSVWVCLSWLKTFGSLNDSSRINMRQFKTYAQFVISLLKQAISVTGTNFEEDTLSSTVGDLIRMMDDAAGNIDEPLNVPVEIQDILQNTLSLLNYCVKGSRTFELIWQLLIDTVEQLQHLPLATLTSACHAMASVHHMVLLGEACIQRHFNIAKEHSVWSLVVAVLVIPELESDEFLHQCLETSSLLTLYAHCLQDLDRCGGSPTGEIEVAEEMAAFISATKPPEATGQTSKAILLLSKFAEIFATAEFDAEPRNRRLVPGLIAIFRTVMRWCEDKDSRGIFGTLGLGSKSPYDPGFRLFARVVATFLATRLVDAGVEVHVDVVALVETLTTLLSKNKEYASLKREVEFAVEVVKDKTKEIRWLRELVDELTRRLFPTDLFLFR